MFEKFTEVRFIIKESATKSNVTLVHWHIHLETINIRIAFDGASVITYDSCGKVSKHLDYWDAAENVYGNLPVIGRLFTFLRKRLIPQ